MIPTIRRTFDNPFQTLRELDRAVNQMWGEVSGDGKNDPAGSFPVDIREEGDHLIVEADLPGFKKEQVDISVEQGVLSIEAERTSAVGEDSKSHVAERHFTRVARRFSLPTSYDTTEVDASLADGVLTLKLPKREDSKPRKVQVK